jgi:integrase
MARREIGSDEMLQLWLKYTEFQAKQLAASTIQRDYGKIAKRLCLMPDLPNAVAVRDWLTQRYATEVVRRTLQQFSACCAWSVRSGYIKADPYALLVRDFRKKAKGDRRAFTAPERDAIIQAFERDTFSPACASVKHSHYTGFVKLLFYTGCRLEEARALQWKHIAHNCTSIRFEAATPSDTNIEGETKTHSVREFPCNQRLSNLLLSTPHSDGLVFPSPAGKAINTSNLNKRNWSDVVVALVDRHDVREFLPIKNTRHTFITLALEAGLDPKDVAYLVGNSAEVIYKHYAAVKRNLVVPDF